MAVIFSRNISKALLEQLVHDKDENIKAAAAFKQKIFTNIIIINQSSKNIV